MREQSGLPDARAAIIEGRMGLVEFDPRLKPVALLTGPEEGAPATYVDIAFLPRPGVLEVLVTHGVSGGLDEDVTTVLADWARSVGIRRVWLPDDVIEVPEEEGPLGEASVKCPGCDMEISADGLDFWLQVRRGGAFPNRCAACGSTMPQWSIHRAREEVTR